MDELSFWRRMNPARLHALYDAWFSMAAAERRTEEPPPETEGRSLYQFFTNGGS